MQNPEYIEAQIHDDNVFYLERLLEVRKNNIDVLKHFTTLLSGILIAIPTLTAFLFDGAVSSTLLLISLGFFVLSLIIFLVGIYSTYRYLAFETLYAHSNNLYDPNFIHDLLEGTRVIRNPISRRIMPLGLITFIVGVVMFVLFVLINISF